MQCNILVSSTERKREKKTSSTFGMPRGAYMKINNIVLIYEYINEFTIIIILIINHIITAANSIIQPARKKIVRCGILTVCVLLLYPWPECGCIRQENQAHYYSINRLLI